VSSKLTARRRETCLVQVLYRAVFQQHDMTPIRLSKKDIPVWQPTARYIGSLSLGMRAILYILRGAFILGVSARHFCMSFVGAYQVRHEVWLGRRHYLHMGVLGARHLHEAADW